MTNQKQIARDLGVSVATVSNALAGKGRVSADVVELVTARAQQLGYVPSPAARALKTGRSGILGLVMPDITMQAFPEFAQGMEAEADKSGFGVLIANARGHEEGQTKAIQQLIQRGVDGIVLIPLRGTTPDLPFSVPVAIVSTQNDQRNTVSANHCQGGELAAKALLDLGHRNFLLLGEDTRSQVQADRISGMIDMIKRSSETLAVSYDVRWITDGFPDLLEMQRNGVTGVLTVSDLLSLRVVTEAAMLDIKCPKDFSVIGFDDLPFAKVVRPTLSTITPDVTEISSRAIAYLSAAIRQDEHLPKPVAVEMALCLRESVASAKPAARH
ncbi:LacI family DNA-binding transcriptional regulator [Pseudahrensia aquimaris]|uniref:LacI family DNA-binding transcriptional regulator n=1 Tax=Pseudahrensia aquimaris TaxID=744461 RepID=A0ABW3FCG2_9HYPH